MVRLVLPTFFVTLRPFNRVNNRLLLLLWVYLKVVPYHYTFVDGETHHTYMYKANYNEYKPRKLEWYEGKADAYVDTDLVPNAAFHYDISPVMVVMREETQSFSSFVTCSMCRSCSLRYTCC